MKSRLICALTAVVLFACSDDQSKDSSEVAVVGSTSALPSGATSTPPAAGPPPAETTLGAAQSAPGNAGPGGSEAPVSGDGATGSGASGGGLPGAGATGLGAPAVSTGPPRPSPGPNCADQCVLSCPESYGVEVAGSCLSGLTCCAVHPEGAGMTVTDAGAPVEDAAAGETVSEEPARSFDYAASVENTSADCQVPSLPEPSELTAIQKLPDPFTRIDGSRLSTKGDWRCRRQEILEQAEKYVYGDKPTPDVVTGSVSNDAIAVHVEAMGTSIDFSAEVVLPTQGQAPYPAIINVGGKGGFGGISLGESRVLEQGVAVIYYNHYQLGQEGAPEQSRGQPNPGLFYDIYGGTHSAGLLMAWAWGASRLIDVIAVQEDSVIDVGSLGVTGCSRNGKGAFAIGVFDERVALTIPHETSTAGVPVYRSVDTLNTERTDHNYFGLNWFSNNFEPFVYANGTSNVVKLPIDTHELVAMVAPRGLLVLDNPHQTQMSAPAGHLAAAAGAEVFSALGVGDHISYHSAVSETPHCSYKNEYTDLLQRNIAKFLKHEDVATGDFVVGQGGDGQLADWKEWTTPTLAD